MHGPIYLAGKAVAKRFHRIVSLNTTTRPLRCRSGHKLAECPTADGHLQKLIQLTATALGTGLQSTIRICDNERRIPIITAGLPTGADHD